MLLIFPPICFFVAPPFPFHINTKLELGLLIVVFFYVVSSTAPLSAVPYR